MDGRVFGTEVNDFTLVLRMEHSIRYVALHRDDGSTAVRSGGKYEFSDGDISRNVIENR